jgi:hypothetical protein
MEGCAVTPKELAQREGAPIALRWIDAALDALRRVRAGEGDAEAAEIVSAALSVNFSMPRTTDRAVVGDVVETIVETYEKARGILVRSDRYFVAVAETAARNVFRASADIPPAYAIFDEAIYFTPRFEVYDAGSGRGFGPFCRAAMVLHESIHVIDAESGTPDVHISEWDEPGFSAQTIEESVHNPSAYASFAAQVHERRLEWPRHARYGAGRRAD